MDLRRMVIIGGVLVGLGWTTAAQAIPIDDFNQLTLYYSVIHEDGRPQNPYHYDFNLTLTNGNGAWEPGQGWGDITFTRSPFDSPDALKWETDSVDEPFSFLHGYFQGRFYQTSLGPMRTVGEDGVSITTWTPLHVGDALHWSGWTSRDVPQGEFKWDAFYGVGGAEPLTGQTGIRISAPEPASVALLAIGCLGLLVTGFVMRPSGVARPHRRPRA